ncbi:MAG: UvrD-helicase domain-containing protein [Planctomycetaceae bacterium]
MTKSPAPQVGSTRPHGDAVLDNRQSALDSPRRLIRASAGTGKTFQLSSRYISILRLAHPERILATTFTRKAAGEILERILLRLALAILDERKFRELAGSVEGTPLTIAECEALLSRLTGNLHRVRIATLDGFFARIATAFSLELGLPIGWKMLDDVEGGSIRHESIAQMLEEGDVQDLRQLLSLLDKGERDQGVHEVTLSKVTQFYDLFRRTSEEAWRRIPEPQFLTAETVREIVEELATFPLDQKRLINTRDKDIERIVAAEWRDMLGSGFVKAILFNNAEFYKKPLPPELVAIYRRLIPHIRASLLVPWARRTAATYDLLRRYHSYYWSHKQESHSLEFSDVSYALASFFRKQSQRGVAYRMDGGIEHVLLDEFQDTSPPQWEAVRPFAEDACRAEAGSFFCVGDVKQAIYGWRQGEAAIFGAIEQELPNIEATSLDKSYRSSKVIMDVVNTAFRGMPKHDALEVYEPTVQRWSGEFPSHDTALDIPGYATLRTFPDFSDVTGEAKKLTTASYVAEYVKKLASEAPGCSVGVLVRKNATVNRIVFELNRRGVACSEEGGNPVTDSAAVQLVLSLLQIADHPGDTVSRYHVAQSPWGEKLGFTDHANDELADELARHVRQQIMQRGYGAVLNTWMHQLAPECNARELQRLRQLVSLGDTFDIRASLRTRDFIRFVETQKIADASEAPVRVMNIHQSKGLEFDIVVLPELDEALAKAPDYYTLGPNRLAPPEFVAVQQSREMFALLPEELRAAYDDAMDRQCTESLCVLYVGMTRAVHALHMLVPPSAKPDFTRTTAGLLRAGLAPTVPPLPETELYALGDPDWYAKSNVTPPELVEVKVMEPLCIQLAESDESRKRQMARVTPSAQEGDSRVKLSHVLPRGNSTALDRGTLFHAWFEEIKWLDESVPSDETLRRIARTMPIQNLNVDQCLREFHAMLRQPQLAWTLSRKSYAAAQDISLSEPVRQQIGAAPVDLEVVNEKRFSVLVDNQLVSGSIDRLVLISRNFQLLAADILDFKTDSIPESDAELQDLIAFYRGQLETYRRAVSRIYQLDASRISARLVLLSAGRIESLPPSNISGSK